MVLLVNFILYLNRVIWYIDLHLYSFMNLILSLAHRDLHMVYSFSFFSGVRIYGNVVTCFTYHFQILAINSKQSCTSNIPLQTYRNTCFKYLSQIRIKIFSFRKLAYFQLSEMFPSSFLK